MVLLAQLVHKVLKELLALPELQVQQVHKAHKVLRDQRDLQVLQVRVAVEDSSVSVVETFLWVHVMTTLRSLQNNLLRELTSISLK
jgi:hypothetical protein